MFVYSLRMVKYLVSIFFILLLMLFFFLLGLRSVLSMHAEMLWFNKPKCGRHLLLDRPLKFYCLSSAAIVGQNLELTVTRAEVKLVAY